MNTGTVLVILLITAILVALALLKRRSEAKEAELRQGRPKGSDHDPPWRYP